MSMLLNPAYFGLQNLRHEAKMIEWNTSYVDETMTVAPSSIFRNNSSIVSIYLPNVTDIEDYAFEGCTKLKIAVFPKVVNIGDSAFLNCTNLESVVLFDAGSLGSIEPSSRPTIGLSAFQGCTNLSTLYLGYHHSTDTAHNMIPSMSTTVASVFGGTKLAVNSNASSIANIFLLTDTDVTKYKTASGGAFSKAYLSNKLRVSAYSFPKNNS